MNHGVVLSGALLALGACTDCDQIKSEAQALRAEYERCSDGDACQVVNLYEEAGYGNCLAAFQCSAVFRTGADLAEFRRRARSLVDQFDSCSECTSAKCMLLTGLETRCNETNGRCEVL
jgi:hypothetical protein